MASSGGDTDTVKILRNLGRQLSKNLASSVDKLLELLDKLELVLSNVEQDPGRPIQESIVLPMKTLISDELLKHTDDDVKVSVTACFTEISRITAPDTPYDDEQMKDFFKLTVAAFENLSYVTGRRYKKALTMLDTFSKTKVFLIMLDLECDDLVIQMFKHFLRIIRSNHPSNVVESMEIVMTGILDESEDISSDLLRPLLDSVRKENQIISPISWTLGEKVFTNCAVKLKPYLMQTVESSGRALHEYAQIVASICLNQSESPEHNHSTAVHAIENIVDAPKDAFETDNVCVRVAEITDITNSKIRSTSAATVDDEFTKSSGSKRKQHCSPTTNSETHLDAVPRKRARKPNSLLNPEEGYDPSWIYKESSTRKSSRSKKDRDNGDALEPAGNSTSSKDMTSLKPETFGEVLASAQPENPSDKSSDVPSVESPTSTKGIKPSNPEGMSKAREALVLEAKDGENTNAVPFTKHPILNKSSAKRCRQRKVSSIGDQNDHPNSVTILKDDNMNTELKKNSLESPDVELKKKSEVRKDSEVTHKEPVRNIKLSIKFDGKVVVPPKSIVTKMESEDLCENEGKQKLSTDMKVENREEGRLPEHSEVNKRRRQTSMSNKGLNKSSAMKTHEAQELGNSLVGKRIKVWWPLDKTYYEGVVNAYDHVKGKHKVLYDDGIEEQLNLKKERWELVDVNLSPAKFQLKQLLNKNFLREEKSIEKSKMKSLKGEKINSLFRSDLVDDCMQWMIHL